MTEEIKSPYRRGADDGFFFGIYLSIFFLLSSMSVKMPILSLISFAMAIAVPVVIYYFLRKAYINDKGLSPLSLLWMHGIMIFICGSLIGAVAEIIYLKWIDPDFIINQMKTAIALYKDSGWESGKQMAEVMQRIIDNGLVPSAISIVVEIIWLSISTGSILSLIIGLIVRARAVRPDRMQKK